MMVRREYSGWDATNAKSVTCVTCEPYLDLPRFSRQSRPSRLSQGSAIAAEAFVNNAG